MKRGVLCVLLAGALVLGCFDSGSSSEDQTAAAPVRGAGTAAPAAPRHQAVPGVPASMLAELANQSLPSIEEAKRITTAYGEILESTPKGGGLVFGASALPEEKARVRAALFRMLDSTDTEDQKNFMRAAVKLLAYYQEGIEGTASIRAIAPDGRPFREIVEVEVTAVTFELARRGHGAPN